MFVKKGDTVVVLAGEDKGKKGKIKATVPSANKVIVDGVNVVSRHKKPRSAQDQGGIVNFEAPIAASNVQILCPVCEKPSRVSVQIVNGKKIRVCKKCGKPLDGGVKEEKKVKKTTKKVASAEEASAETPAAKPAKKTTTKKTATKKAPVEKAAEKPEQAEEKAE